jgi:hypothetical protein
LRTDVNAFCLLADCARDDVGDAEVLSERDRRLRVRIGAGG